MMKFDPSSIYNRAVASLQQNPDWKPIMNQSVISAIIKANAEMILSRLGIPMSTAVDMFLNQVVLSGGIPFSVTLPKMPANIDASQMTDEQFHAKLQKGYNDYLEGNTVDAKEIFKKFTESHS